MKFKVLAALIAVVALAAGLYVSGLLPHDFARFTAAAKKPEPRDEAPLPPAVTVTRVVQQDFVETVMVTGTLVPRDEILVAPEIDGFRVLELRVDEGDTVRKGDVLATLVPTTLEAQVAQSDASLARGDAAIARAQSAITESEARLKEAEAALKRAAPLTKSGYLSESTFDQRDAAAKAARAQLVSAQDGLKLAVAEKQQVEAQRRELDWRLGNTEVKSPADGIVSRRTARVGGLALSAGEPMFHIVARGEIELDAEVPEAPLAKVKPGQKADIEVAGVGEVPGSVRIVSPEVNKATRLGRVRIFLGDSPQIRIGAFGRGTIKTADSKGLSVPLSAVLYGDRGPTVQVVRDGKIATADVETGLMAAGNIEIRKGLQQDDLVVARAGTFLRDGDAVRPIVPGAAVSDAAPAKAPAP
jgi:HlyD family secretion protein